MSNTNVFHSSSLSISDNERNDTVSNTNDQTSRSLKGFDKKKKRLEHSDTNNNKKVKYSSDDIPSTSSHDDYCQSCVNYPTQEKLILPFSFDPKKHLQFNGCRKTQPFHSTLGQIKLPTASNGRLLIQPEGEIKFRATTNSKSSLANLKQKRTDSSSPIKSQLEVLYRLCQSSQSEEFHGPLFSSKKFFKSCFLCRKSSIKQGPSIHCDYCPLTYHLDCLTPLLRSLPLPNEKWMCPNHMTPILDRYLSRKNTFSTSDRVKIYYQYGQIEEHVIQQDFTQKKPTKTINNHQLEQIDISQIPKIIEEFYSKAKIEPTSIPEIQSHNNQEIPSPPESSSAYDPSIWDILQAILNDIVNNQPYEFSSKSLPKNPTNTLETLSEPNLTRNDLELNPISSSISYLIDLTQFRLSHAALIHLRSENVIYIRKHVIWFGSSPSNDICLENFHSTHICPCITERHACLYYDQKRNQFELLNYSEYGTIVNDLRYGIGPLIDDICSTKSFCHSTWDGPAQIEQGTVIQIGCHEFLFYRHIVR